MVRLVPQLISKCNDNSIPKMSNTRNRYYSIISLQLLSIISLFQKIDVGINERFFLF